MAEPLAEQPPTGSIRNPYAVLNEWFETQKGTFQNRRAEDGPPLPPADQNIITDRAIFQNIAGAFARGCQAATNNLITGPEIPADMISNNGAQAMWAYYNLGLAMTNRERPAVFGPQLPPRSSTVKLPDPPKFTGDRYKLEEFIKKLYIKFNMEKERFPRDVHKISYASSFLEGDAGIWFSPYVNKDNGEISFKSYSDFLTALRRSYGDPNRIATAEREVMKLKQTGSIDLYYSKFKEYMDILDWTDGQKIHNFRLGLKERVKDFLSYRNQYTNTENFEEFYNNARNAENDMNIRYQETNTDPSFRRTVFKSNQSSKPRSTAFGTHSGPMDLTAAPRRTSSSSKRYTRLSRDEKEQRFKKGQCFYCKETGHFVNNCPKAKKGAQKGNNWKKPNDRKALVALKEEENVVFSLGGTKEPESKN
jgi:hypothetical protein